MIYLYGNIPMHLHLHLQSDSKHDAANAYAEAAKCYKKVNTNGMSRPLENLMVLYISQKATIFS